MPRDGSGNFNLPAGNPVSANTVVSSTWANSTLNDLGAALTQSLSKDGQTVPTANLPMGNNKITNLANGTLTADAVTLGQMNTAIAAATGRLIGIQTFLASGTYTPTSGTTRIIVKGQGAGGGGGGSLASGAGQVSMGGGGGAGAIGETLITSGFSGASVTIGTGGAGVSSGTGNTGTGTAFGAFMTLLGGVGGNAAANAAVTPAAGGAGGVSSGGTVYNIQGQTASTVGGSFASGIVSSGRGADSLYGSGGSPVLQGGGATNGVNATGRGAGGSGSATFAVATPGTGGSGGNGIIIVYEYA